MIESPSLDPQIALELLELARVVAHMSERRFAPLSCFLAGVAAERMRVTCGSGEDEVTLTFFRRRRLFDSISKSFRLHRRRVPEDRYDGAYIGRPN